MKTKQLFWGIFLITLGGLVLINNFYPLNFDWDLVWNFWPIVLIVFGVYFVLRDSSFRWVFIILNALVLGLVIFAALKSFIIENSDIHYNYQVQEFNAPYKEGITKARLTLEAAAGNYTIKDTTNSGLVDARSQGSLGNFVFNHYDTDQSSDVSFELEQKHIRSGIHFRKNHFEMKLNSKPAWDLDLNVGAASVNLDLEPFNLENLYVKSGAASVKVKLGDKADKTDLKFESGVSSLEVQVPKSSGCEINTDTKLSSKNFNGFTKIGDNVYRSENFDAAVKKVFISFETGVSSVKVNRY